MEENKWITRVSFFNINFPWLFHNQKKLKIHDLSAQHIFPSKRYTTCECIPELVVTVPSARSTIVKKIKRFIIWLYKWSRVTLTELLSAVVKIPWHYHHFPCMTFPWLSMTVAIFHDFSGPENGHPKFHDFPWPGGTLITGNWSNSNNERDTRSWILIVPHKHVKFRTKIPNGCCKKQQIILGNYFFDAPGMFLMPLTLLPENRGICFVRDKEHFLQNVEFLYASLLDLHLTLTVM